MKTYKAFDKDMKCRDFQFKVGKTYTHEGKVKACESGFHSCENPLDVLNYYDLCNSRFAVVEASGEIAKHGEDSKIASASITIEAELHLPQFVAAAVEWIKSSCTYDGKKLDDGNYSQLAASGDSSQLAASGNYSQLAASGDYSIAIAAATNCKAKAGKNGTIVLTRWVDSEKRYRVSVGYVGENIKADTWYELDSDGNFVEYEQ